MYTYILRSQAVLAVGGILMLASVEPAAACGRWCGEDAYGNRRPAQVYGSYAYRAALPQRPPQRPLSRAQVANTLPPPRGSTTLDPPGMMTTQGILESPVPTSGPTLFGSASPVYADSAFGSAAPRRQRPRRYELWRACEETFSIPDRVTP
jgi:hypothetical protein